MSKGRVIFYAISGVIALALIASMFCISISTGIGSLVFGIIGLIYGNFVGIDNEMVKLQKDFFNKLLENKEDFLSGKILTVTSSEDSDEMEISIKDAPKPKKKVAVNKKNNKEE